MWFHRPCRDMQATHQMTTFLQVVCQVPQAQDSITEPGCGVSATVEGRKVAVGKLDWVQQQARLTSHSLASSSSSSMDSGNGSDSNSPMGRGMSGQSVVYVGLEGQGVIGALGFSDTLRPDAQYVVQQLHSRGIQVVVLSGMTTVFSSIVLLTCCPDEPPSSCV